jgi:hypothetical protein
MRIAEVAGAVISGISIAWTIASRTGQLPGSGGGAENSCNRLLCHTFAPVISHT